MATTFSTTFKNRVLDGLTGRLTTNTSVIKYIQLYNGAVPIDPLTAPAGNAVFSGYAASLDVGGFLSSPSLGVSVLAVVREKVATNPVADISFGRVYDAAGAPLIDVTASLAAGAGGVILSSLASTAGQPVTLEKFSVAFPRDNAGTVKMNYALVNMLTNCWAVLAGAPQIATSGFVRVYSGAAPATADAPATGTLLAQFTGAATTWAASVAGSTALVAPLSTTALANGTAGYVRIEKGSYVLQGSVGTTTEDFILDTTTVVNGLPLQLVNATISW